MTNRPPPTTQTRPGGARRGFGAQAAVSLVTAMLLIPWCARAAAQESAARVFAAHALELRAAGVAGEARAAAVLADMPGAAAVGGEVLPLLWSASFANAIVKLGRVRSPGPVALYYDPLHDVAVLTFWRREDAGYRVASARALPGERLDAPEPEVPLLPSWTTAQTGLVESMTRTTAARLDAFRRVHPADAGEPGRDGATFASAAADMRAVLPRLAWSAAERARWTDEAKPWLRPAVERIDGALAARDPAVLTAAAPETDAGTAAVLADLPAGFAQGLRLDMAIEAPGPDRLLIASLPADGDVYVLMLCRLEGGACALRRFMLASLLE